MTAFYESNVILFFITKTSEFLMIFGGVFPYIPQYLLIRKTKLCEGFSTFVCLTLLLSNILRLCFWYGRPFELPLVIQSLVMIVTMIVVIQLCISVTIPELTKPSEKRTIWDLNYKHVWRWTEFSSYLIFLVTFAAIALLFTHIMLKNSSVINLIGFLALFLESMLGAPQFYRNYKKQSTKGMSISMVCMWTSGDIFKTVYFVLRSSPEQFVICGSIQVTLDLLIMLQYFCYDNK